MIREYHHCYISDRDVYELLISSKQKITKSALLKLARSRGIFFSPTCTREELVSKLAPLTYDYSSILDMIEQRDPAKRAEKTTCETLNREITQQDIRDVIQAYTGEAQSVEKITHHNAGPNITVVNIAYDEIDYSKTRLIQRQRKEAQIEIVKQDGITTIRRPVTDKSRSFVDNIKNKLESKVKSPIEVQHIELTHLLDAEQRTLFFISLMSELPNYRVNSVTGLNVGQNPEFSSPDNLDLEEEEEEEAEAEMLAVVKSVHFSGEHLIASKQYQNLKKEGFFITAMTWKAEQLVEPKHLVKFQVGFDNALECKDFRYLVRYAPITSARKHTTTFRDFKDDEKREIYSLIEDTARLVLKRISSSYSQLDGGDNEPT